LIEHTSIVLLALTPVVDVGTGIYRAHQFHKAGLARTDGFIDGLTIAMSGTPGLTESARIVYVGLANATGEQEWVEAKAVQERLDAQLALGRQLYGPTYQLPAGWKADTVWDGR
jgi:hypothetical protein